MSIKNHFCPPSRRDERLELQWSLEGHQLGVVSVDISHTLPIAASSSLDAHIRLWDLENGKQIKSIDAGPGKNFTFREGDRNPQSLFRRRDRVFLFQNCRHSNPTLMSL